MSELVQVIFVTFIISYVMIDTILLLYLWWFKEIHLGYKVLWIPIPLTGIIFYRKYLKMIREVIQEEKERRSLV